MKIDPLPFYPDLGFLYLAYQNTAFFRYSECEIPLCIPALLPVSTCEKAQSDFPDKPHRNFHYLKISRKYYG